ncbi:(2Fe-2S)-binding protein [Allosphingosinicella sp.]|jgi:bacterioferritin-associated ferredoxin|uniref:(2Fe-2S)-binding protein n=1 Tax=Allosphingosinicella sp. TaxID=2823234 RepID=UPI002EF6115D
MVVCICNAIREKDVRKAARDGASCPATAYEALGRRPRCGQCFSFAREIIASERATA